MILNRFDWPKDNNNPLDIKNHLMFMIALELGCFYLTNHKNLMMGNIKWVWVTIILAASECVHYIKQNFDKRAVGYQKLNCLE